MLSVISNARLLEVHPELQCRVAQLDQLLPDLNLQVSQGLRTWNTQYALWLQGHTISIADVNEARAAVNLAPITVEQNRIVTDAPPGYSAHNFGYAVDVFPEDAHGNPDWNSSDHAWERILSAAPTCGLAEGAKFLRIVDDPHLYLQELPATPTDEMRLTFKQGGLVAVWADFKIGDAQ
jgi:D-alanyl-D-alanine carboxypeptidase